jgi:hypothetical protein
LLSRTLNTLSVSRIKTNSPFNFFATFLTFSPILAFAFVTLTGYEYRFFYRPVFWFVAIFWLVGRKTKIVFPKYLIFLLCYILYKLIWDFHNYQYKEYPLYDAFKKPNLEIFVLLIILENTVFDRKLIERFYQTIKVTLIFAVIFSLIQFFVDSNFFSHDSYEDDGSYIAESIYEVRRNSVFSYIDMNSLGLDFLPLFSLFLAYSILNQKKYIVYVLFASIIVFGSNTRYIMVGFLIVLIQLIVYSKKSFLTYLKYFFVLIIIALLSTKIMAFFGYDYNSYVEKRLFAEGDISGSTRYFAFQVFSQFFPENWILGTGEHLTEEIKKVLGSYTSQIHVGYLSHLVSYGVVGSFFLFMFWFKLGQRLFITARKTNFYGSFFAFLVFFWANATLVYYSIFTYGLIIALVFSNHYIANYHLSKRVIPVIKE